eukprot:354314-Chlamydomonas_euryale.AAC.11
MQEPAAVAHATAEHANPLLLMSAKQIWYAPRASTACMLLLHANASQAAVASHPVCQHACEHLPLLRTRFVLQGWTASRTAGLGAQTETAVRGRHRSGHA